MMKMKAHELAHWPELFRLPPSPWIKLEWKTVLTIYAKFLHRQLLERESAERGEMGENAAPAITFHEIMEMGVSCLGIPQLIVALDIRQNDAESQLAVFTALCVLRHGVGGNKPRDFKNYRDVPLPDDLAFNLGIGEELGGVLCSTCNTPASPIERLVVDGRVWHRTCLKCAICKRQLPSLGSFHGDSQHRFECVEHMAGQILFGDAFHQFHDTSACTSRPGGPSSTKTTAMASPPPPRPPPPRLKSSEGTGATAPANSPTSPGSALTITQQIEQAAGLRHDTGGDEHCSSLSPSSTAKTSPEDPCAGEKNWEMLSYPVELNPFESDEEESEVELENEMAKSTKSSTRDGGGDGSNPFDEDGENSDIEEVENPSDRVDSSLDSSPHVAKTRSSRSSLAVVSPSEAEPSEAGDKNDREDARQKTHNPRTLSTSVDRVVFHSPTKPEVPPPPKPPRIGESATSATAIMKSSDSMSAANKRYFPPLAPMIHRPKKLETLPWLGVATMNDLLIQLRKLQSRMTQIETTGKRLEAQILRAINSGGIEWKKSKIVEEYVLCVERKCESLRIEAVLVRRWMELFVTKAHGELENQLKSAAEESTTESCDSAELEELLAKLMNIKNELLAVEAAGKTNLAIVQCKATKSSILPKGMKSTLKSLKKKL